MPIRTDLVISIGEILDCLPPGKLYKKKRYSSSFNAGIDDVENEENVWPPLADRPARVRCDIPPRSMKSKDNGTSEADLDHHGLPNRRTRYSADGRKHSVETLEEDEDTEVSFHPDSLNNGDSSGSSKPKGKRKSSAEKFLEDNSNYFQLEVLASKTRSSKIYDESSSTKNDNDGKDFHNSFLDFLKSKEVDDPIDSDSTSAPPSSRSRHKSGPASSHRNGGDYSPSPARSDSTDSTPARSLRGGDAAESPRPLRARGHHSKPRSMSRLRSRSRDFSLSESEPDTEKSTLSLPRKETCSLESSDDESSNASSNVEKRTRSSSLSRNHLLSPGKRARRSELSKLLEAVDTSFHFETAAAAAKRLSDNQSDLGPLEIDVSDSNIGSDDETSHSRVNNDDTNEEVLDDGENDPEEPASVVTTKKGKGRKRKHTDIEGAKEKIAKRRANKGNLLKTMSPSNERSRSFHFEQDFEDVDALAKSTEALDAIQEKLGQTDGSPVNLEELYVSFECPPQREAWFQTYSRQDRGDDIVYYPESKIFPFALPYELPLSTFLPQRPEIKGEGKGGGKSDKRELDIPMSLSKKSRICKVSESESTDSENNNRRTKCKFGLKTEHLQDLQPRISPRCHASTKAVLHPGPLTDDDIIDGALFQDDTFPFPNGFDEASNDSLSSVFAKSIKQESTEDYANIASSIDEFIREATGLKSVPPESKDGASMPNVPTRSRISSDLLLKNMKPKKKKEKRATSNEVVMDNFVTENVDPIFLDCLEEELPTVPLELDESDVVSLVTTYELCKSMSACNKRWLKPSRPSIPGGGGEHPDSSGSTSGTKGSGPKNHLFGNKPKRLVIYKEDLPGFKFDNDIESEKLPISKRMAKKCEAAGSVPVATSPTPETKPKVKSPKEGPRTAQKEPKLGKKGGKKPKGIIVAKKTKIKEEKQEDEMEVDQVDQVDQEDNCSETSSASGANRKKKVNKTGFPIVKKKKLKIKKEGGVKKEKVKVKKEKVVIKTEKEESDAPSPTKTPPQKAKKTPKIKRDPVIFSSPESKEPASTTSSPTNNKDSSPSLKPAKEKVKKKVKINKTVRSRSSSESPKQSVRAGLVKRSTTLKSKNYSELESDTESLLEAKVPYRSPHMKAALAKQQAEMAKAKRQKNKTKK